MPVIIFDLPAPVLCEVSPLCRPAWRCNGSTLHWNQACHIGHHLLSVAFSHPPTLQTLWLRSLIPFLDKDLQWQSASRPSGSHKMLFLLSYLDMHGLMPAWKFWVWATPEQNSCCCEEVHLWHSPHFRWRCLCLRHVYFWSSFILRICRCIHELLHMLYK